VTDPSRPDNVFDEGLQHERTALAWERTAVATMVAGVVLARFAAVESFWIAAVIGLAQTAFGGVLLVWSGTHYDDLHEPLRKGDDVENESTSTITTTSPRSPARRAPVGPHSR